MNLITSFKMNGFEYFTISKLNQLRQDAVDARMMNLVHKIDMAINEKGGGGIV